MRRCQTPGAALAIVTGLHLPGVRAEWPLGANTFVFLASVLLLQAVTRRGRRGKQTMVLVGIPWFTFIALVTLLQYAANPEDLQELGVVLLVMAALFAAPLEPMRSTKKLRSPSDR